VKAAAAAEASAHVHHLHASQDEVSHEKEGREPKLTSFFENIKSSSVTPYASTNFWRFHERFAAYYL
jgi:hypothetical protein